MMRIRGPINYPPRKVAAPTAVMKRCRWSAWSKAEDKILKQHWGRMALEKLSLLIGRPVTGLRGRARLIKLPPVDMYGNPVGT